MSTALLEMITAQNGATTLENRKLFATKHFTFHTMTPQSSIILILRNGITKKVLMVKYTLRRKPTSKGFFFDFDAMFNKVHGKELSYNNLLDVDAAVNLINEF
jgi:phosphoribosylaminoimidazolecarboxamide formyltransferase/IMP cyclohydrolase